MSRHHITHGRMPSFQEAWLEACLVFEKRWTHPTPARLSMLGSLSAPAAVSGLIRGLAIVRYTRPMCQPGQALYWNPARAQQGSKTKNAGIWGTLLSAHRATLTQVHTITHVIPRRSVLRVENRLREDGTPQRERGSNQDRPLIRCEFQLGIFVFRLPWHLAPVLAVD
jgi:hypothetical protein